MEENYTIADFTAEVPVREYVDTCVDVDKFLGYCRACRNYEKNWACPSLGENPMTIWNAYDTLRLYARVLTPGEGMTSQQLMAAFCREKELLSRAVLDMEHRIPGSRAMAAGTCTLCGVCTRGEGNPCRHPEQVRYSIEALGGDVGRTMEKYLHRPLQWFSEGELPRYLTLAAGLLLKDSTGNSCGK